MSERRREAVKLAERLRAAFDILSSMPAASVVAAANESSARFAELENEIERLKAENLMLRKAIDEGNRRAAAMGLGCLIEPELD